MSPPAKKKNPSAEEIFRMTDAQVAALPEPAGTLNVLLKDIAKSLRALVKQGEEQLALSKEAAEEILGPEEEGGG